MHLETQSLAPGLSFPGRGLVFMSLRPFVTTLCVCLQSYRVVNIQSTQPFLLPCVGISAYLQGGWGSWEPFNLETVRTAPPLNLKEALANTHLWRHL